MKKIAIIVALIVAGLNTNAATIPWGSNGTTARFLIDGSGGTGSSNRLATGSLVALVYLGNETSFTFDDTLGGTYSASNTGISGGTVVDTLTLTSKGTGQDTYDKTPYTAMNGNYGMIFFNAPSWDKIDAGTQYGITTLVSPVALTSENDNQQNAFLTGNVGLTGTISATPIPEPGTAAMALLGLGLLIRRRKA